MDIKKKRWSMKDKKYQTDEKTEKKKYSLQECWLGYLFGNIMCLCPIVMGFLFEDLNWRVSRMGGTLLHTILICVEGSYFLAWLPVWFSWPLYLIFLMGFFLIDTLYWIFYLHYVHIALELLFMIYAGYMLRKTKDKKMFNRVLAATVASVLLNLLWAYYGVATMGV